MISLSFKTILLALAGPALVHASFPHLRRDLGPPPDNKVLICHVPPGDPSDFHTIRVGEKAVAAHLAHGDYDGGMLDVLRRS